MADWRLRAEVTADVVFFPYVTRALEKRSKEVFVWDLDKTYLDTKFETVKGLARTIMEKAFQKKNVPGTAALVRALKHNWENQNEGKENEFPIYFITASPPQLERRIYDKLIIDGIYPFGIFFKDNLKNLKPRRLWRLTQQVGFKIQALLQLREHLQEDIRMILWGDDSESDVIIYNLFSDICARRLDEKELSHILKSLHVVGSQMDSILELQSKIPFQDPVEKIYINLAEDTDAEYYIKFGRRTLPCFNTFQCALDLFQDRRLDANLLVRVAQDMVTNFGFTTDELEKTIDELIRRHVMGESCFNEVVPTLQENGLIDPKWEPSMIPKQVTNQVGDRVYELEGDYEPWVPEHIDYLHDYR